MSDLDHREKEDGMSALHLAVSRTHEDTALALLKAGASVNVVDNRGNNVMLTAAIHSDGEGMLLILLKCCQTFDLDFKVCSKIYGKACDVSIT